MNDFDDIGDVGLGEEEEPELSFPSLREANVYWRQRAEEAEVQLMQVDRLLCKARRAIQESKDAR